MIERVARTATSFVLSFLLVFSSIAIAPSGAFASGDYDYAQSSANRGLNITVSWDEPKGGVPTVFHLEGAGGSGAYQYQLNAVDLFNSDNPRNDYDCEPVTDSSRHTENGYAYQDSPEISFTFMASGLYRMWFCVRDVETNAYARFLLRVRVDDASYPSIPSQIDAVVSECLAQGNSSEFDKALWLHDWVIDNMEYDDSLLYCGAEGAFLRKTGTCETYHRAYVKLLEKAGLKTGRIEGNGHVWTAVRIDGKWCQVDATWDDAETYAWTPDLRHLYFGLDDRIMGLVHSDHSRPVTGLESTTLENNYFVRTGGIKSWADPYAEEIAARLAAGAKTFDVAIENSHWPDNYKNVVYNLVAYDLANRSWDTGGSGSSRQIEASYASDVLHVAAKSTSGSWRERGGRYWYQYANGGYPRSCWARIDGSWYHFDGGGWMQTGWLNLGGAWYWLDPASGKMRTGWLGYSGSRYYLDGSGAMLANRWAWFDGKCYYFNPSGRVQTGWVNWYGTWYWMNPSNGGAMATGLTSVGSRTCFFRADGSMVTGWQRTSEGWRWFGSSGYMGTGWLHVGGTWYWLDPATGIMATGWQEIGGSTYFLYSSGAMATGWRWIDGKCYYFGSSGRMARSQWIGADWVDETGAWVS